METDVRVTFELQGWTLFFAWLQRLEGNSLELSELRNRAVADTRRTFELPTLAADPAVAALRKLFRQAGCDPTRYRPSSEALLRRVLKGADLPAISPFVDINNCLSLRLAVPCCVMAAEAIEGPYVLRAGRSGESYASLKGPFNLEGKPLLVDARGPCDAPITGSERVKIRSDTLQTLLVAYLPTGVVSPQTAAAVLEELLREAPVAEILGSGYRPAESEETQDREDG